MSGCPCSALRAEGITPRGVRRARSDVFDYIEMFCNKVRRHSHLGGVSPEAFELDSEIT